MSLAEIHHDYVQGSQVRLHVARAGNKNGDSPTKSMVGNPRKLIIFLHGFPESWVSWRPYLHALSDEYLVVAPDNRGFNESSQPASPADYQMPLIVADIHALAIYYGATEATPFTLVGHDWGGMAAWHFAARYPKLLKSLVTLNAPHPDIFERAIYTDPAQHAASQYINRLRDPGCEARLQAIGLETFWMSLFAPHLARGSISITDKENQLRAWSQPGAITAMLNWYRASTHGVPDEITPAATVAEPGPALKILVPTLVVWGMQDPLLLPCLLDGLDQYVPQLTIERISDAGHGLIHEQPEQIIKLLRAWILQH